MRALVIILLFFAVITINAQNPFLKKLEQKATKALSQKGSDSRVSLDSVDFQFAISINQGAGFFDIEQKGETGSKLLYSLKSEEEKTLVEKARDSLEIGIGLYGIRRYELAEIRIRETKEMMEANNLTNEIVYLRTLSNLGLICMTQGKLGEASEHISSALATSEDKIGRQSPAYIANLNNQAKLYQLNGKYTEAEKAFDEAINNADEVFGGGMQQAIILNNKAMLYQALGQYDLAVDVMKNAIDASGKAPKKMFQGEKSFDNRKFKANLATLYQTSGRYQEAEQLFLELKSIFEKRKQTKNAEYAGLVNQLGILYIQMGQMDKVSELLLTSLNVYRRRWGENNIYYAKVANDLGNFHRINGQYSEADNWLTKAFNIRKQLLDNSHPDYTKTQEDLAILRWKTGNHADAYALYDEVMSKTLDIVKRFFPSMSEAEKTKFWDITSPRFQRFYNFSLETYKDNPAIVTDVYNYNIATKGLLLNATSKVRNIILTSDDEQLKADYLDWLDQKEQLARLYTYSKNKLKAQNINLSELEAEANRLEKNLSERSSQFLSAFTQEEVDYATISTQLDANEVVVDFIRVRGFDQDFTDEVRYMALIALPGSNAPTIEVVENGALLESRYAKYYRNAIQHSLDDKISFEQFWAGIEPRLAPFERVYFSPDGVYNQVNINTLRMQDDQYVINKHDLVVIGNSKDLLELKSRKSSSSTKDAFLLGYPEYGSPSIPVLPGSKTEIETISGILSRNGYSIDQFMEAQATEGQVKKINNPNLVHIATHGFFMKDTDTNASVFGVNAENASDNPLLKSGLILAGTGDAVADTTSADISNNDNGILTAYEAMNLNLDETTLVVLSACETGLGEIKSGEGVYGLQRAFQVAGTDALIMSLWKVSDEATQKLMTSFYSNWIKLGDKHEAFRTAQLDLMKEYDAPYFWGAFVMIGG